MTTETLSDHLPFVVETPQLKTFAWNILCQMRFAPWGGYYNNGFGCEQESIEDYRSRLIKIASTLFDTMNTAHPDIITLQECPKTEPEWNFFIDLLRTHPNYQMNFSEGLDSGYYLATLYNPQRFQLDEEASLFIRKSPLKEGLKNRILPLVFFDAVTETKFLSVNVHANFTREIKTDLLEIINQANQLDIYSLQFQGDFNRDLVDLQDNSSLNDIASIKDLWPLSEFNIAAVKKGSLRCDPATREKTWGTRDGVIQSKSLGALAISPLL